MTDGHDVCSQYRVRLRLWSRTSSVLFSLEMQQHLLSHIRMDSCWQLLSARLLSLYHNVIKVHLQNKVLIYFPKCCFLCVQRGNISHTVAALLLSVSVLVYSLERSQNIYHIDKDKSIFNNPGCNNNIPLSLM